MKTMKFLKEGLGMMVWLLMWSGLHAQVAINNTGADPDASAMLDIQSNSKGILIPRMTAAERDNIAGGSPPVGLLVFVTDDNQFYYYDGTQWLPFGKNDGDWQVDGSNMYSVPSGNVGIGITTPAAKLHVVGNTLLKSTDALTSRTEIFSDGSQPKYGGLWLSQGSNYAYKWSTLATGYTHGALVLDYIDRTDGNPLYEYILSIKEGKLGIGLYSPQSILHIKTPNDIDGVTLENNNMQVKANVGVNQFTLWNMEPGKSIEILTHQADGTLNDNQLFLSHLGYIGIGTNLPQSVLHIVKDVTDPSDGNSGYVKLSVARDDVYGGGFHFYRSRGTHASPVNVEDNDILTYKAYQGYVNGNYDNSIYQFFRVDGVKDNDIGGWMYYVVVDTLNETHYPFTIRASGKVGINQLNPQFQLDVNGWVRHGKLLSFYSDSADTGYRVWAIFKEGTQYGDGVYIGAAGTTVIGGGESARSIAANYPTNPSHEVLILASDVYSNYEAIKFITSLQDGWDSRVEAMTILGNGNVGIGTTAPTTKLHVEGGKVFVHYNSNTEFAMHIDNRGGYARGLEITGGANTNTPLLHIHSDYANGTDEQGLWVESRGRVGIGTTTPDEKFVVDNGTTIGRYTTSGWTHSSDARFKTNIRPISDALDIVKQLRGVRFEWKNAPEAPSQIGFIAQEVKEILPEVIVGNKEKGYGMAYGNITAVLVEAIKEQQRQIEAQQAQIQQLRDQIQQLRQERSR